MSSCVSTNPDRRADLSDKSAHSEEGWRTVMTKRSGAPPLRFKGSELARHADACAGFDISITLWKRRAGGFVAAIEVEGHGTSSSQTNLQDAMSWLEAICGKDGRFGVDAARWPSGSERAKAAAHCRAMRILAGEALSQWDLLAESHAV